jgi:alkanesulfonate monooxygenase SsuD/methylene tetrahydromethanopterin reductase-like flavin-dependent oxidoreductase (luciferase family)
LPPPLDEASEAALRAEIICGTPADVAARIAELAEIARVAGPDFTFIARMHYPGMDPRIVRAAARLFAEEVIPAVRARVSGSG